jgi:DnaJ domain
MQGNYYQILGIDAKAKPDEIKRAYRQRAKQYHPDLNPSDGAAEQFIQISLAYEILYDERKRAAYDQRLAAPQRTQEKRSNTPHRDEAYRQWVADAQRRAYQYSQMEYTRFYKSKFEAAEARTFLYLQFLVFGMVMLIGTFFISLPILAFIYVDWKCIFFAVILVPMALKIYSQGWRGLQEIRRQL